MGRAEALMTARAKVHPWHGKRTDETRKLEEELRKHFPAIRGVPLQLRLDPNQNHRRPIQGQVRVRTRADG